MSNLNDFWNNGLGAGQVLTCYDSAASNLELSPGQKFRISCDSSSGVHLRLASQGTEATLTDWHLEGGSSVNVTTSMTDYFLSGICKSGETAGVYISPTLEGQ